MDEDLRTLNIPMITSIVDMVCGLLILLPEQSVFDLPQFWVLCLSQRDLSMVWLHRFHQNFILFHNITISFPVHILIQSAFHVPWLRAYNFRLPNPVFSTHRDPTSQTAIVRMRSDPETTRCMYPFHWALRIGRKYTERMPPVTNGYDTRVWTIILSSHKPSTQTHHLPLSLYNSLSLQWSREMKLPSGDWLERNNSEWYCWRGLV